MEMQVNSNRGENLKRFRGKRTQEEVAKALGIPVSTYGSYEQGARIPKDSMKVKIARYFNKSVEEIFFK